MSTTSADNPKANRYTLEEKREAVAIMVDFGGLTYDAQLAVQSMPKFSAVSRSTLGKWYKDLRDKIRPQAIEIIQQAPDVQIAVGTQQDKRLNAYNLLLERMNDATFVKSQTNLNHIATAWAILEERMRLSIGLTTEIVTLCKRFVAVVSRKGFDPVKAFEDVIESYEQEPDVSK